MSSAPPSDRRRLRRAAVAVDAAAVGVGRDADDVPERFGELAAVIIPKLAGNIQHRAVGLPQEPGSAMHFLRARNAAGDMPYTPRKLLLMSVAEAPKRCESSATVSRRSVFSSRYAPICSASCTCACG